MSLFLEPYCALRMSYDTDVIVLLLNESDTLRAVASYEEMPKRVTLHVCVDHLNHRLPRPSHLRRRMAHFSATNHNPINA